jgi:archaellum component FlaC
MINSISESKIHQAFDYLIPYMKYFFDDEVAFTMSNNERFLKVVNSENIIMDAKVGDPLRPGGAAYECIKAKKPVSTIVSKEVFGVEIKAIGIPVKDDNGAIIGSIVLVKSVKRHQEVLKLSKDLSDSLELISEGISEMSSSVQNVVSSNNIILSKVEEAITEAKDTDEVLSFVKNVAGQTNLLGLNAAIEASRAGDSGRGFNVVAKEIRKLSSSSSDSIKQINEVLNKIKNSVSAISENVNKTGNVFQEEASQIQKMSASIEELRATAQKLTEIAGTI